MKKLYVSGIQVKVNGKNVFAVDTQTLIVIENSGERTKLKDGDVVSIVSRDKVRELYLVARGRLISLLTSGEDK